MNAALENLILDALRATYLKETEEGYFVGEIYADYRDELGGRTAGEIIDADHPTDTFWEKLSDWYFESEWWYKDDLVSDIKRKLERTQELDDEDEEYLVDYVRERVCFEYPADHFLDEEMYVNIYLDTGDCNYDFVLNSAYPCWYGRSEDRLHDRAGIVWLAKSQGYNKTQLWKALKDGDMADPKGFLQSMRVELANLPSHMSTVTFLVKMSFRQLLELNEAIRWRERQGGRKYDPKDYPHCGYIVLGKDTMCGLFDPWGGGGSVLEVQLERDVKVPIRYIWMAIPDEAKGHGYQVGDVYGLCGSAWQDTLKEMHFPKKMLEAV